MSSSNPAHRAPKIPAWPFPASPLHYPTAPPAERPVRPPVAPRQPLPDTPAPF